MTTSSARSTRAIEEAEFAVAGSYEAHRGWVTHPDGSPLEPQE
ncbi:MAG: hypothetical protein AB7V62_00865 [Thermoleophilia bacterium]